MKIKDWINDGKEQADIIDKKLLSIKDLIQTKILKYLREIQKMRAELKGRTDSTRKMGQEALATETDALEISSDQRVKKLLRELVNVSTILYNFHERRQTFEILYEKNGFFVSFNSRARNPLKSNLYRILTFAWF